MNKYKISKELLVLVVYKAKFNTFQNIFIKRFLKSFLLEINIWFKFSNPTLAFTF